VVEGVDVASAKTARVSDEVSKLEGHLVQEAQRAAARGLGKPNTVGLKLGERVGRQALCAELDFDGRDEVGAERARSALRTPARKTENNVPACVSRMHFCRSIQSRFRYQSSSVGGSSMSVIERPPSRSSIFFLQRTTIRRT